VVRVRSSKDVVCHIRAHVARLVVVPNNFSRHGLNLGDGVAFVEDATGVDVALYVVLAALPLNRSTMSADV
jgi:hypothetical protein